MNESADSSDRDGAAYTAFTGPNRIATGTLTEVAVQAKRALVRDGDAAVLVFQVETGRVVDLDLRGTEAEVLARHTPSAPMAAKRGRPKLGVVAREVTLLPRHWEWLSAQPGGTSVALRKLVEAARRQDLQAGLPRARAEAAYRFMSAMAGDMPNFEEAARSLFAGGDSLREQMRGWPADIRDHVLSHLGI